MSNDPDLLDRPCPECEGLGVIAIEDGSSYYVCAACDGEGVVLR